MEIYLVGGAVRDQLIGRAIVERDWVVVGSSPEEMLKLGYRQVGRDFPVFLHPETQEEYALARTERKTGPGHVGFECHTGADVTLEDDLERRDLTINAMARDADGVRIDPYGGSRDVRDRILRHVSDAFGDDPLRVFRVARFAAQLPGFTVAEETLAVMTEMAEGGELETLSAERVWRELAKALAGLQPLRFFGVLRAANALQPWLMEFAELEVPLPPQLQEPMLRFGALGWLLTPPEAESLSARLKAPKAYANCIRNVSKSGTVLAHWRTNEPQLVYQALKAVGAFRPDGGSVAVDTLFGVVAACGDVDLGSLATEIDGINARVTAARLSAALSGAAIGKALDAARIAALSDAQER